MSSHIAAAETGMKVTSLKTGNAALTTAVSLAQILERLERSQIAASAAQYRLVAQRLADAIGTLPPGAPLDALLAASPAAAEIYENLNYQHAGLCRAPLEAALNAELKAHGLIARMRSAGAAPLAH